MWHQVYQKNILLFVFNVLALDSGTDLAPLCIHFCNYVDEKNGVYWRDMSGIVVGGATGVLK